MVALVPRYTGGYSLFVSHTSRESLTRRVLETVQKASGLSSHFFLLSSTLGDVAELIVFLPVAIYSFRIRSAELTKSLHREFRPSESDRTSEFETLYVNYKWKKRNWSWKPSENVNRILEITNSAKKKISRFEAFDEMRKNCEGLAIMHIWSLYLLINSRDVWHLLKYTVNSKWIRTVCYQ